VAEPLAHWDSLGAEIVSFPQHITELADLVGRLAGFDVIVAMRERTPFPRELLEQLPFLVTPHIGFVDLPTYEVFFQDAVADIEAWQGGRPTRVLN
jgi:phosphoglycerate dehydrogenase-like enzyme